MFKEGDKVYHAGRKETGLFVDYWNTMDEARVDFGDGEWYIVSVCFLTKV
jgi:hypothetical protein